MQKSGAQIIPGYTGYKPQFQSLGGDLKSPRRENRFYIPGYSGYVPKIKAENAFGESYGKTTSASMADEILTGVEHVPKHKFISMTKMKFTNQHALSRRMRPADTFEPGYDRKGFSSPVEKRSNILRSSGEIFMNFSDARTRAFSPR